MRLLELRYDMAAELAAQAGRLADADVHTWQVLATSEFLRRRPDRALDAWNRSREPVLDLVQVRGLERTRYRSAVQSLDLTPGTMLTAATIGRAQLRLTEVPAFDAARIEYVPVGDGLAEVTAGVVEKPSFGSLSPMGLAATAARAVSDREAAWTLSSLTKNGETITAAWRWWENRPQVSVDARIPVYGVVFGGILHIAGVIAEQPYDVSTTSSDTTVVREHRRSASVTLSDWSTRRLRWSAGGGVDRWKGRGVFGRVGGSIELRVDGSRGAVRIAADGWPASDGFGRIAAGLGWRTTTSPAATGVVIAAGATHVRRRSPLDLWPGAGTGQARDELLRAHPLLDDGIVSGAAFGRQLLHATSELRFPFWSAGMLRLGGATFVDAARVWNGRSAGRTLIDVGGGLRLHLSGEGTLRVDFARGATDGARAVSLVGTQLATMAIAGQLFSISSALWTVSSPRLRESPS